MALYINADKPQELLENMKKRVQSELRTVNGGWGVDNDGDFYNDDPEVKGKCWMRPIIGDDSFEPMITFGIVRARDHDITVGDYADMHTKLAYFLLCAFDKQINEITISQGLVEGVDRWHQ